MLTAGIARKDKDCRCGRPITKGETLVASCIRKRGGEMELLYCRTCGYKAIQREHDRLSRIERMVYGAGGA